MNPLMLKLIGLGGGAYLITKFLKKPAFQSTQTMTADGKVVKISVPVPDSVNASQAMATSTTPPVAMTHPASAKALPLQLPKLGIVYAPPKSVQPGSDGKPQPTAIITTPTGASSVTISSIKDVQRALNTLGYTPRLAEDGTTGPKTAANIKIFQSKMGLAVDGNAGPATKAALSTALTQLAGANSPVGAVVVASMNPTAIAANAANAAASAASGVVSSAVNPAVAAVQAQLSNLQSATAPAVNTSTSTPAAVNIDLVPAPAINPANALTMSNSDIQGNLNILGATPPLTVDGQLGPMSIAAIKAFQTSHGLTADGIAGPQTKTAIYIAVHTS